jgi:hypothetical protein
VPRHQQAVHEGAPGLDGSHDINSSNGSDQSEGVNPMGGGSEPESVEAWRARMALGAADAGFGSEVWLEILRRLSDHPDAVRARLEHGDDSD